jgi:hypothetical protein
VRVFCIYGLAEPIGWVDLSSLLHPTDVKAAKQEINMAQYSRVQPNPNTQQYTSFNFRRSPMPVFAQLKRGSVSADDEVFRSEWRDPVALRFRQHTR